MSGIQAPAQQPVHQHLMTSALPKAEDFARMAALGFEVVISLGRPEDNRYLRDEDFLVTVAGMRYLHLPVDFSAPTFGDYELLRDLLNALYPRKVWLHCAENKRVSALIFLYNVIDRSVPIHEARARLHLIWQPDEIWQAFIDEALEKYVYQYV
ncbi:protein tyrosine phosphatase family protein [Nitratifractor sp.]|uniref:protein tyrosine phosphatase family protein n=1 Tax=Nitratifractor sp. TaxID=2268144 RepID=UPI0025D56AE4|nr:protein tyrosine phosphatase family protein [Nitratifractor sp.]